MSVCARDMCTTMILCLRVWVSKNIWLHISKHKLSSTFKAAFAQNLMLQWKCSVSQFIFKVVDASSNDFHRRLARRLKLSPAQHFWSSQSTSRCGCQSHVSVIWHQQNTLNYTTWHHRMGPVMFIRVITPYPISCFHSIGFGLYTS